MRTTVITISCLLLALAVAPPGGGVAQAEDLTIVSRVTPPKGSPTTSTQYVSEARVRTSDGASDTIIDVATGQLTVIEHKRKKYYETSLEEIRAHFAELEALLEENPFIGEIFGAAALSVEKGEELRQVAGYSCRRYDLRFGPNFRFEVWATPDLEVPLEYYDAQKLAYAEIGPFAGRFEQMFEEMKKIDGVVLATIVETRIAGLRMRSESEATEVKKGPIAAEVFAPPAGYKEKKSPYRQR